MTTPAYALLAETACCLWEAMIESRMNDDCELHPKLEPRFENYGSAAMRMIAVTLAVPCEEVWRGLTEDEQDKFTFDWEFVPHFLNELDWSADTDEAPKPDVPALIAKFKAWDNQ